MRSWLLADRRDPEQSKAMLVGVLDGEAGAPRDIVLLNAGATLYAANVADSIGIGIETGPVMIGFIGAEEHMKQGAIGNAVNVASRVQQLSTVCGYSILFTPATRESAGEEFCDENGAISCGLHEIRGRSEPMEIFGAGMPHNKESQNVSVSITSA